MRTDIRQRRRGEAAFCGNRHRQQTSEKAAAGGDGRAAAAGGGRRRRWGKYPYTSGFDTSGGGFGFFFKGRGVKWKGLTGIEVPWRQGLVAEYLERNFDVFFAAYNGMLEKGNYVTRRQSLKLLSELLLDRANINSMMRYIGSVENLCLMMNLLRDEARSIQFEAFHVFKVFVANPNKPPAVLSILMKNREKMIGYLANFQNDREDEQFIEEKAMLTRLLEQLGEQQAQAAAAAAAAAGGVAGAAQ